MKKNAQEIRAVLKGCAQGLSAGRIAAKTAIPKTTVQRMISRGKEVNVQYDQAKAMTDFALEPESRRMNPRYLKQSPPTV